MKYAIAKRHPLTLFSRFPSSLNVPVHAAKQGELIAASLSVAWDIDTLIALN